MFCRHLLHETPQVEGIGIKTNQFGSSLPIRLSESGDPLLMVSVEDDGGTAYHLLAQELIQIFVFLMDEREEVCDGRLLNKYLRVNPGTLMASFSISSPRL